MPRLETSLDETDDDDTPDGIGDDIHWLRKPKAKEGRENGRRSDDSGRKTARGRESKPLRARAGKATRRRK
jgi:hypothetical protein